MSIRGTCWRPIRLLVTSALLLTAAACSGSNSTSSAQAASGSTGTVALSPAASPAPELQQIEGNILGGGDVPGYTAQMPATWTMYGGRSFMVNLRPAVMGLSVWNVGRVPRDPCHWKDGLSSPGPTVDDLTAALERQRLRNATTPTDVTLAGYEGSYLELSVPADSVVTGDADFEGCDDPGNGHQDFVTWFGVGMDGERYERVPGEVDRVWVLDVNGQRLVVDGTYSPDATAEDIAELEQVASSIHFG